MSLDPDVIRSERHAELSQLLRRKTWLVIERWTKQAHREQPSARGSHYQAVLDHLPELLESVAVALADGSTCQPHAGDAVEHGEQRWHEGWTLPEVIRDFQILRLVIINVLDEELERPLAAREAMAIGLVIDEAISASVTAYIAERDDREQSMREEQLAALRAVQRELEEKNRLLEVADQRKDEFLAMLAHELRNPLSPLRNCLSVLQLAEPGSAEVRWTFDVMQRQLEQLSHVVDDLLDISRISSGTLQLTLEPVEAGALVTRAVELAEPLIRDGQLTLTIHSSPEPAWVNADIGRLTQVLSNLLVNAAKYTDPGGSIALHVSVDASEVVFAVIDTGVGISAEALPTVFEVFSQEPRSRARARGGLGLGLALVRRLVDLHGGRVQAASDGPGRGSRFVVALPRLRPAPPKRAVAAPPTHVPPCRILVVDDNRDAAESLRLLLRISGHDVVTAYDGRAAVELAAAFRPDVVLLDIGLPSMDGYAVAQQLRAHRQLAQVHIIAVTGFGQPADRTRSLAAGISAHLVKPVDFAALQRLIGEAASCRPA